MIDTRSGLKPLYCAVGPEELLVQEAVEGVTAAALRAGVNGFNRSTHRASDANSLEALGMARTLPMMGGRRLVVVRGVEEANAALLAAVLEYCERPAPETVLVLAGKAWPTGKGLSGWGKKIEGAVARQGEVVACRPATREEAVRFVMARAQGLGPRMARDTAAHLVVMVGTDLSRLALEVEKVVGYIDGRPEITEADLNAACSLLSSAEIWDLTDAIAMRDANRAMAALHRLLEDGEPEHRLLSMLAWQLRQLILLQLADRHGRPPAALGLTLREDKLNALRRALKQHRIDPHAVLDAIVRANAQMNSSRAGGRRVMEALVLGLLTH